MQEDKFKDLVKLSLHYGSDSEMIQAGGGNTSVKLDGTLWVKASGIFLKDVNGKESFVSMDLSKVNFVLRNKALANMSGNELDSEVNRLLVEAKIGSTLRKPSIETFLHALMKDKLVAHTHPLYVNAMVCSSKGLDITAELFEEFEYLWLDFSKPGYPLGYSLLKGLEDHNREYSVSPSIVFLQNHGMIVSGRDFNEINMQTERVVSSLKNHFGVIEELHALEHEIKEECKVTMNIAEALKEVAPDTPFKLALSKCPYVAMLSRLDFHLTLPLTGSLYPDHIVYCGEMPLFVKSECNGDLKSKVSRFVEEIGYMPRYVIISGVGVIIIGGNDQELSIREEMLRTHVKTLMLIRRHGDPVFMAESECKYIAHWEAEKYRQQQAK